MIAFSLCFDDSKKAQASVRQASWPQSGVAGAAKARPRERVRSRRSTSPFPVEETTHFGTRLLPTSVRPCAVQTLNRRSAPGDCSFIRPYTHFMFESLSF